MISRGAGVSTSKITQIVNQQLEPYCTEEEVQELIDERVAGGGAELVNYLKKKEAADTYATQRYVEREITALEEGTISKEEADSTYNTITAHNELFNLVQSVMTLNFYTKPEIDKKVDDLEKEIAAGGGGGLDPSVLEDYATKEEVEDNYTTKTEHTQLFNLVQNVMEFNFYTKDEVDTMIEDVEQYVDDEIAKIPSGGGGGGSGSSITNGTTTLGFSSANPNVVTIDSKTGTAAIEMGSPAFPYFSMAGRYTTDPAFSEAELTVGGSGSFRVHSNTTTNVTEVTIGQHMITGQYGTLDIGEVYSNGAKVVNETKLEPYATKEYVDTEIAKISDKDNGVQGTPDGIFGYATEEYVNEQIETTKTYADDQIKASLMETVWRPWHICWANASLEQYWEDFQQVLPGDRVRIIVGIVECPEIIATIDDTLTATFPQNLLTHLNLYEDFVITFSVHANFPESESKWYTNYVTFSHNINQKIYIEKYAERPKYLTGYSENFIVTEEEVNCTIPFETENLETNYITTKLEMHINDRTYSTTPPAYTNMTHIVDKGFTLTPARNLMTIDSADTNINGNVTITGKTTSQSVETPSLQAETVQAKTVQGSTIQVGDVPLSSKEGLGCPELVIPTGNDLLLESGRLFVNGNADQNHYITGNVHVRGKITQEEANGTNDTPAPNDYATIAYVDEKTANASGSSITDGTTTVGFNEEMPGMVQISTTPMDSTPTGIYINAAEDIKMGLSYVKQDDYETGHLLLGVKSSGPPTCAIIAETTGSGDSGQILMGGANITGTNNEWYFNSPVNCAELHADNMNHDTYITDFLPDQYSFKGSLRTNDAMMKVFTSGEVHAIQFDFGYWFIQDNAYDSPLTVPIVIREKASDISTTYNFIIRRVAENKHKYACTVEYDTTVFSAAKVSGSGRYLTIQSTVLPYADSSLYEVRHETFSYSGYSRNTISQTELTDAKQEMFNTMVARCDPMQTQLIDLTSQIQSHTHTGIYAPNNHDHSRISGYSVGPYTDHGLAEYKRHSFIPIVDMDGYMEIGKHIDFHDYDSNQSSHDYAVRLSCNGDTLNISGKLAVNNKEITGNETITHHTNVHGEVGTFCQTNGDIYDGYKKIGETDCICQVVQARELTSGIVGIITSDTQFASHGDVLVKVVPGKYQLGDILAPDENGYGRVATEDELLFMMMNAIPRPKITSLETGIEGTVACFLV